MACPQVNKGDVKRLLEEAFSYSHNDIIYIKSLGSCQDANFKVKICDSKCDKKFVLKFSNLKSTFEELKFQNDLIIHTAAIQLKKTNGSKDLLHLPRPIEITNLHCRVLIDNVPDKYITQYRRRLPDETEGDEVYFVRLFSYVEGSLMSDVKHLSLHSLREYGRFVAYFCDLTSHFREYHGHSAEIPPSDWAIETAVHHINKYAATLSDVGQTAMFDFTIYKLLRSNYGHFLGLDSLGSTSSDAVSLKKPLLALAEAMYRRISDLNRSGQPFRRAVLHGDLALYNLVTVTAAMVDSGSAAVEVSGVIDFGDACESWVVGELVVAIASVHGKAAKQDADQADSLLQAASMVAGFSHYCSRSGCPPLTEEEVTAIWPMLVLRAVLEMFVLAHQQQELQHSCDGSGSSTLKYCEDGLKGIKKAFAAVLRVPPYLAQAHLLSVATTKPPHSDGHANHIVLEDCADNKTYCSSLYSISRSQSAFNNDPSSGLAPLSLRDSSAIGKFLSPAETPAFTPSTVTPVSSRDADDLSDMDNSVFPAQHGGKRVLPVDFQILSTVFEKSDGSNITFGRRIVQAQRYGSQHQDGVSLVSKLLFSDRQEHGDRIATRNRMTVDLNAPWPFKSKSVHFFRPLNGIAADRDVTTRAEFFYEQSLLLRSPPDSCEPDLLISADMSALEDESVQFRLPCDQLEEKCGLGDSEPLNPKGTVFASVEFAAGSKPALFVQLIPKGVDLTSSAHYHPVSFLPPRYCPGVYRSTYSHLCPNPSALLPMLFRNFQEESVNKECLDSISDYGVDFSIENIGNMSQSITSTNSASTSMSDDMQCVTDDSSASLFSIKDSDAKVSMLHRSAEKRGGLSKVKSRYQGLQTYEQMLKAQAFKRMQDGLRDILQLHTPIELSSICGCLHLKVQEKGCTSIDQIIRYASENETLDIDRIMKVLHFMWETPLWEYLHSTGHPVYSMRPDPKNTILELWENGGFLEGAKGFNPHFIAREVKKRYEGIKYDDISSRLDKLRRAQEAAKLAETKIIASHDYTNILTYFKKMYELRSMENEARDYLIGELEVSRGRLDSGTTLVSICREQLEEAERFSISIANTLNKKLAYAESVSESLIVEKCQMEADLQTLMNVLDSYFQCQMDRTTIGGGKLNPKLFRPSNSSSVSVMLMSEKLKQYKELRDDDDSALRERSRSQLSQEGKYQSQIEELKLKLAEKTAECEREVKAKTTALEAVENLARTVTRLKASHESSAQQSWSSSVRFADTANKLQLQLKRIKPLLLAGLSHTNPTVFELCFTILSSVDLLTPEERQQMLGMLDMTPEDPLSIVMSKYEAIKALSKASRMDNRTATAEGSTKGKGSPSRKKEKDNASTKSSKNASNKSDSAAGKASGKASNGAAAKADAGKSGGAQKAKKKK